MLISYNMSIKRNAVVQNSFVLFCLFCLFYFVFYPDVYRGRGFTKGLPLESGGRWPR